MNDKHITLKPKAAKAALEDMLARNGYWRDSWGHYRKKANGKEYRYKMQATSWRKEVKSSAGWVRIAGEYYGKTKFKAPE